jgi:hypothetical protein
LVKEKEVEIEQPSTDKNRNILDLKVSDFLEKFPVHIRYKNIIPIFDKNKTDYAPKSPGYNWKSYQKTKYPIKELMRKRTNNYGVICGDPLSEGIFLIVVDLDNRLFLEHFQDEETLIIKTPNGGYHIYYHSKEEVNKKKRFLKLPIDVQGIGSYVIIPPSSYDIGCYEVIKSKPIKIVDNFLDYVLDKLPNSLKKLDELENSQPSDIKQFKKKLHNKISLLDVVKDHFPNDWYEPQETREHGNVIRLFNPLKKQESDNPSFVIFDETHKWYSHSNDESGDVIDFIKIMKKESSLDHALQYLQKKYGIKAPTLKQKKDDKLILGNFDEFLKTLGKNTKTINHGMDYHNECGLVYASVYPEYSNGMYGISCNKPIRAILKPKVINEELPDDIYICEGYTYQLNPKTRRGISNLLVQLHKQNKFQFKSISELFDTLLKTTQVDYLELENENIYYFLILWILGTYLRPIFVWFPYITFYGLRDVGKSTALTLLSNMCFNGSGYISGNTSEASLFRKASSTKGFFAIDHYEEMRKSKEKRQVITQYLESAWYLNSTIDKVNKETLELETFKVASSVAIGTREIDDVLEEKGIIIQMVETSDKNKRKKSARMHKDTFFENIQQECMATALIHQKEIIKAYESIEDTEDIEGLEGRDYNKFLPILALAKVIDDDNHFKYKLYNNMVSFGVNYRKQRKEDLKDTEEVLLKLIIQENIELTTYSDLSVKMVDNGIENYTWQTAKSDLTKLHIIQRRYEKQNPIKIEINLENARKRAKSRGINLEENNMNSKNEIPVLKVKDDTNQELEPSQEINYEDIPLLNDDSIKKNEVLESYNILTENVSIALRSFVDKLEIRTDSSCLRCFGVLNYLKEMNYVGFKSEGWIQATNEFIEHFKDE